MKTRAFRTITGRTLDLAEIGEDERRFLGAVQREYEKTPEWSAFAAWWVEELRRAGLGRSSVAYRICQDLEARLGIAQGKVAPPDYRDFLADLIEERYGSRYRFCKEAGVDPGHLSRVLANRSEFSLQTLQRVLEALHASLVIQPEEVVAERLSPSRAGAELAAAVA
ncbi:MAG: helix-turn-helix domain-containing protein [Thermoanaerobaculia bacterium]